MQKKLIHFDEQNYTRHVNALGDIEAQCQKIVDKYKSLKIEKFNADDIHSLIWDTENFLFEETMKNKPLEVAGMKVSKEKLYDLLEKPSGYNEVKALTQSFIRFLENRIRNTGSTVDAKSYFNKVIEFSSDGKPCIKQSMVDEVKNNNEVYITTEKGNIIFELANRFIETINKPGALKSVSNINSVKELGEIMDEIIELDFVTKKAVLKVAAVKRYDLIN